MPNRLTSLNILRHGRTMNVAEICIRLSGKEQTRSNIEILSN